MQQQARKVSAGVSSLLKALKSCSVSRDLPKGKIVHAAARESGEESEILVANSLINMYAKCGSLSDARTIFDRLPEPDIVSWNSLILGYADNGHGQAALELFSSMRQRGYEPNSRTYLAAVKACCSLAETEVSSEGGKFLKVKSLEKGAEVHGLIRGSSYGLDVFVYNALVDFYARCGSMADARSVFDNMPGHTVVSWTSLLMGYVEDDQPELAVELFDYMVADEGCEPDSRTYVAALKACTALAETEKGEEILKFTKVKTRSLSRGMRVHALAAGSGCGSHIFVTSTLVDFYAKCGSLMDSRRVFDRMEIWNVVSWTSLVLGCVENGEEELALDLLACMEGQGCEPDARVFAAAFKACSNLAMREPKILKAGMLERGREIHAQATRLGCDGDLHLKNTLVEFYARTGNLEDAAKIFDSMQVRNVVSWNSLMLELAENGDPDGVLALFFRLIAAEDCRANGLSFVAALKACTALACLSTGKQVHSAACRLGVDEDTRVHACLLDFYAKCGSMVEAQIMFDTLESTGLGTWNSLLAGYSRQGSTEKVAETFGRMRLEGTAAEEISLVCVLNAYSHAGLVDAGKKLLSEMSWRFGVAPGIDHYNCVIDGLGRANRLEEAVAMVKTMGDQADRVSWRSVFGACAKWKNVECGRLAYEKLVALGETEDSTFVLMQNLCAAWGLWEDWSRVEVTRSEAAGLRKQ